MLSAAYKINERLVGNVNKDTSKCSAIILVALTLAVTAGYMAWIITSFMRFKCSKVVWWQVITLVCIVGMYILQFCGSRKDASILTTGLAALYIQYLQWTALSSDPSMECRGYSGSAAGQIVLGVIITFFALFMMSGTAPTGDDPKEAQAAVADEAAEPMAANATTNDDESKVKKRASLIGEHENGDDSDEDIKKKAFIFPISKETITFQLIMMLSSMYYAMLCTNWLEPGLYTKGDYISDTTYWLKMVALWLSLLVYLYSMIAPLLFPDRQF